MTEGIHYRYSDYLETNIQIGLAGNQVISVQFTDNPEGEKNGVEELDAVFSYLDGEPVNLDKYRVALTVTGVEREALERTRDIARGETLTYRDLARSIGREEDLEEVMDALDTNPVPLFLPSHRVIDEDDLGGFVASREIKRKLLELEGGI